MIVKTKAIVLTSLKYGDSDLIVKCFTEEGVKTYLLKRIFKLKSKKARLQTRNINIAYFQPLTQLNIIANHNNKGSLNSIREAGISYLYHTLATDIYKQSIAIFLAEVLTQSLQEEEKNKILFQYIEAAFIWLDNHDSTANFHLIFLLNLTKYLGFYPATNDKNANYFDLVEGLFSDYKPLNNYVFGKELIYFKSLIGIKFDDNERLHLNSKSRKIVLNILLEYFELHLPGFKKPKSLNVLNEVFNEIS